MAFNIKDFVSGLFVKIKSTTDGSNGEVTHHHVDSSALPAGAATSAKQDDIIAGLASIDGALAGGIDVTVSGGSTEAKQDTANAALGAPSDAEATGNGTITAILKRIRTLLGNIGAGTASGSLRVTVATDDGLHTKIGEVQTTPTANTMLARLKTIGDAITAALAVVPQMASGGNTSAQTNATGSSYTAFASQACKQLTLVNNTGTTIVFQQGGSGAAVPVFDKAAFTIFGITNANQIGVKRDDNSNTQVTVAARWEA